MTRAALARLPGPTTWAHHVAGAWTAAWLTARGRHVIGTRELLADATWRGELRWLERDGARRRGHRPDLVTGLSAGGRLLAVEVELASKSTARLRAILGLHAGWVTTAKTLGVVYVCDSEKVADRVRREARAVNLTVERKTMRIELLPTIRPVHS